MSKSWLGQFHQIEEGDAINIQDVDGETKEPCVVKKELIKDNCDVALKSLYRMHLWFICIICMFAIKVYTFVLCMNYLCVACRHAQQQFEICIHPRSWKCSRPLAVCGRSDDIDDIEAAIVMEVYFHTRGGNCVSLNMQAPSSMACFLQGCWN